MGILADLARKEITKRASEEFDKIDLNIYNRIIVPLEDNIDLYQERSALFIEYQEAANLAYDTYEDIQTIRTNVKRARKTAEAAQITTDSSDKASRIASALDKISAAISFGLKILRQKLGEEIAELKDVEKLFGPTKVEFGIRKQRIIDTLKAQKRRFDLITENRRKQQEKITAKRNAISARRQSRLEGPGESTFANVTGPIGQARDYVVDTVNEVRRDLFTPAEAAELEKSTKTQAIKSA
tara:strand:+ start:8274 stop:8996 length:723 start_codon:yes stop_codon:yes gene_type:complete